LLTYYLGKIVINIFFKIINKTFSFWEKLGIHITPDHFYSTIPNVSNLDESLWEKSLEVPGIDFNYAKQIDLISYLSKKYRKEFEKNILNEKTSEDYYPFNEGFSGVDGEMLYYMVRHLKPSRIIEIGSGFSTLLLKKSLHINLIEDQRNTYTLKTIDPYPNKILKNIKDKDSFEIIPEKVQEIPLSEFNILKENDLLFIDSSHVLKIGSDVQYEYLEIIPGLNRGVITHCHDIFMPSEYPGHWVKKEHRFWNEQYLLQAFLSFNREFKIIWAGSYMHLKNPDILNDNFILYKDASWPLSFYFKRI
jgi:predicted O-methyltransferase YrrM